MNGVPDFYQNDNVKKGTGMQWRHQVVSDLPTYHPRLMPFRPLCPAFSFGDVDACRCNPDRRHKPNPNLNPDPNYAWTSELGREVNRGARSSSIVV